MVEYSALIIDDDIWMQRILSKTLQNFGFVKTFLASNGFEGIALSVEHLPHLIIMDIMMPELSGHLALKVLKHIKCTKDIPVLMVSALSDSENLGLAVKIGTAGYISKPFTRATIYDKLLNVFGSEKLDAISKGLPFEYDDEVDEENYYEEEYYNNMIIPDNQFTSTEQIEQRAAKPQSQITIPQEQIVQHYQDEERKNIESIKKLLLKIKK